MQDSSWAAPYLGAIKAPVPGDGPSNFTSCGCCWRERAEGLTSLDTSTLFLGCVCLCVFLPAQLLAGFLQAVVQAADGGGVGGLEAQSSICLQAFSRAAAAGGRPAGAAAGGCAGNGGLDDQTSMC